MLPFGVWTLAHPKPNSNCASNPEQAPGGGSLFLSAARTPRFQFQTSRPRAAAPRPAATCPPWGEPPRPGPARPAWAPRRRERNGWGTRQGVRSSPRASQNAAASRPAPPASREAPPPGRPLVGRRPRSQWEAPPPGGGLKARSGARRPPAVRGGAALWGSPTVSAVPSASAPLLPAPPAAGRRLKVNFEVLFSPLVRVGEPQLGRWAFSVRTTPQYRSLLGGQPHRGSLRWHRSHWHADFFVFGHKTAKTEGHRY